MAVARMVGMLAVTGVVGMATLVGNLTGCARTSPPPEVSELTYSGPPISLELVADSHIVVVHTPTGGWKAHVDRVTEGYKFQGVYVSLTMPNPAFSYAPTPVEQRLASNVLAIEPVKVFARVVDFKGESITDRAYSFAAQSK